MTKEMDIELLPVTLQLFGLLSHGLGDVITHSYRTLVDQRSKARQAFRNLDRFPGTFDIYTNGVSDGLFLAFLLSKIGLRVLWIEIIAEAEQFRRMIFRVFGDQRTQGLLPFVQVLG